MYYTMAQYDQVLAARLWFRVKSIKSIAEDWEISVNEVRTIQGSEEYCSAVETLIRTTRSPGNLLKWIESAGDHIPSGLAKRMGLPDTVVSEMIEKIKQNISTKWNIRH